MSGIVLKSGPDRVFLRDCVPFSFDKWRVGSGPSVVRYPGVVMMDRSRIAGCFFSARGSTVEEGCWKPGVHNKPLQNDT